jgi:hypothetical protein
MRKSRKNSSKILRETWENVIIDPNIDKRGSKNLLKLVYKNNIRWNQKFKDIGRSLEYHKFILIYYLP